MYAGSAAADKGDYGDLGSARRSRVAWSGASKGEALGGGVRVTDVIPKFYRWQALGLGRCRCGPGKRSLDAFAWPRPAIFWTTIEKPDHPN